MYIQANRLTKEYEDNVNVKVNDNNNNNKVSEEGKKRGRGLKNWTQIRLSPHPGLDCGRFTHIMFRRRMSPRLA